MIKLTCPNCGKTLEDSLRLERNERIICKVIVENGRIRFKEIDNELREAALYCDGCGKDVDFTLSDLIVSDKYDLDNDKLSQIKFEMVSLDFITTNEKCMICKANKAVYLYKGKLICNSIECFCEVKFEKRV